MAQRRMFALKIIDSDAFLDLPVSAQALYFHIAMRADDDGFVNKPRAIMNMIGANNGDMKILLDRRFLLLFDSGVVVVKAWRVHNYIRRDAYTETSYTFEKAQLWLKKDGSYTDHDPGEEGSCRLCNGIVTAPSQECDEDVTELSRSVDTGKVRIGKDSIGKDSTVEREAPRPRATRPTQEEVAEYAEEIGRPDQAERFFDYYTANGWKVGKNAMKDWRAAYRNWCSREKEPAPAASDDAGLDDMMRAALKRQKERREARGNG